MKHIKEFLWLVLMLLGALPATAQTMNKLVIGEVPAPMGREIAIPIQMDNTDDVTAIQFDITVSSMVSIRNEAVSTDRWDDHTAVVRNIGSDVSRVMLYSPTNASLKGSAGNVVMLKAYISEACNEFEEIPVSLSNVIITDKNGSNIMTAYEDGKLVIEKAPDLIPSWISEDKTSVNPSDTIQCSWSVRNAGDFPTTGGWKEQIYAVSYDGKRQVLLGSQFNETTLPENGEVVRSMKAVVPEVPGIGGQCYLMVKIVPGAECGEPTSLTGNNTSRSNSWLDLSTRLYLEDIKEPVGEINQGALKYKLTRSGSTVFGESFRINVGRPDSRVKFPYSIDIPQNQASAFFYVTVTPNDKPDESDKVEFSITGNQYPKVSSTLTIIDDVLQKLNLSLDKEEVTEGESFNLTVNLPRVFSNDMTVYLSSDNTAKIKVPSVVVIPAGQTSVTVPLTVIDNEDAELQSTVTLRATGEGVENDDCEIDILDNDMPSLSLTFSPSEVSENAGISAIVATVKRLSNVDKNARLLVFDDSNGALQLSDKNITMAKGVESAQFVIGVKDNDLVDGDKQYNVTVAVYSSACDCYASELSGGLVTKSLAVIDDDGPHLSVSSGEQSFLEGSKGNKITVSRNTAPDSDITVTISSDKDDMLEYNHTAVIPAGSTSVDVPVSVLENEVSGDGGIVSFKAESEGMAAGSCWVIITDQTLPDAKLKLEVAEEDLAAGDLVDLILTVSNVGNAPLQRNTPVDVSCSGVKGSKRFYTKDAIEKGGSERLVVEEFQLPKIAGNVTLSAIVNGEESVKELLYSNNRANSVTLALEPAFNVTVSVDKPTYRQGEEVVIRGHASGDAGKNAKVDICLMQGGFSQNFMAETDENGDYEYKYKLLSRQAGHFTVSASYPTSSPVGEAAAFDVYGIVPGNQYITCEPGLGETFNGTFCISNPGTQSQSSLKIEKLASPENCEFSIDAPSTIMGGESIDIKFTLKGTAISEGKEFEKIPLSITTAEGAKTSYDVYYYIQTLHGKLYTATPSVKTTMLKDSPRDYPLVIRNIGKGETGKITFALPSWIETATPREMASLASGDSTTVVLRFKPMDDMKLNVAVKGKIGMNCANGDGVPVSFEVTPVSEATGKLKIDVVDEFTFYTEEAPHVSNALVKISHPTTKEVVAEGRTGSDGIFAAEMNEGWYTMTIEAENHDIYSDNIIVSPGTELSKEVFIPYQAITANWDVKPTEIEDEYIIEQEIKFDTRVPKPIIVISLPDEKPEPYSVIPVNVTNKGLINAVDIEMSLEVSRGYTLEFLNDPTAEVLSPQQTITFYAKLIPVTANSNARIGAKAADDWKCIQLISKLKYQELCEKYKGAQFVRKIKKYGKLSCSYISNGSNHIGGSGPVGGGPGHPEVIGGGKTHGSDSNEIDLENPQKYCDPKSNSHGDDPIDLPLVDNKFPEEQDCDKDPVLVFKLVPVKGKRYSMKGVTADGASQVKLVLDPSLSKIPNENCGSVSDLYWELDKKVGSIEGINDYEAIYTAPNSFDESLSESYGHVIKISAQLHYTLTKENNTVKELKSDPIEIRIYRPLIVLIHGLSEGENCWRSLKDDLVNSEGYFKEFVYLVDYKDSSTEEFINNINYVRKGLNIVKRNALVHGIIADKIDIIGHGTGGILARLYAQNRFHDDEINRIITVNTPHAGSEIGDMVRNHPIIGNLFAKLKLSWDNKQLKFSNIDAISNMAVESNVIYKLNHPQRIPTIPVYSYVLETLNKEETLVGKLIGIGGSWVLGNVIKASIAIPSPYTLCAGIAMKYIYHLSFDDALQAAPGDLVVSSESQIGGCEAYKKLEIASWHVQSPHDYRVRRDLISIIKDYSKDSFSKNWFKPKKRSFNNFNCLIGQVIDFVPFFGDLKSVIEVFMAFKEYGSQTRVQSKNEERVINVKIKELEGYSDYLSIVNIGDNLIPFEGQEFQCWVPNSFKGDVTVTVFMKNEDGNVYYASQRYPVESYNATLDKIEADDMILEIGESESCRVKCYWSDGTTSFEEVENVTIVNPEIAEINDGIIKAKKEGKTNVTLTFNNLSCEIMVRVFAPEDASDKGDDSDAICSTVTLSFKQQAVMTRQAFRGTFSLNNGHKTATLRDFKLNLEVKDEDGVVATRHEFEIDLENLKGFKGDLDFNNGWSLEPSQNGEASILFIPTKYAAPTEPKEYSFGGTFSYIDPYTGLTVTRTLNPVTLIVNPSPQLDLTYFMQRDVFGDDPLTEAIEPMKPAEFALLINNVGSGDSANVKLTTNQPQIVSNEKGLYVNFEIIGSQLNGGETNLTLGGNVDTDFGAIKAGEQSYAQWWLRSSLLGHFTRYDVKATHITSHDNPDLTLLDKVTIHELIHGFDIIDNDVKRRAFLVNDIADDSDTPDQIYLTDGTQADVKLASSAYCYQNGPTDYTLTVTPSYSGWNYGSIKDPTNGRQVLTSIKRGGTELSIDNFWQTDRTLRDGKDPLAENLIHFVDKFNNGTASYQLTFSPRPDVELAVDSIIGIPAENEVLTDQLRSVTVRFNKPINPITFTAEDLSLTCQGEQIALDQVSIMPVTGTDYQIDLSASTLNNGFYVLGIQTASIADSEGFAGSAGSQASWIQYAEGKVKLTVASVPEEGGTVTPATGLFDYDSTVTLEARPAAGYQFLGWWCGDDLVSETPETQVALDEDKAYTARFALQQFKVTVDCDGEWGYVEGTSTGIYDFGHQIRLEAVPNYGCSFSHWTVDGNEIAGSNTLELSLDHDTEIYATFVNHVREFNFRLSKGWNWISSVFNDKNVSAPSDFFKSIRKSLAEVRAQNGTLTVNDGNIEGSIESITPGTYKVKVNNYTALNLKGIAVSEDDYTVNLSQGWTWLPYVPTEEQNISDALADLSACENDVVKSHTQFAVYTGGRWLGTLKSFIPGEGYMYYASEPASFKFASPTVAEYFAAAGNNAPWQCNEKGFADNKTVIARIWDNGVEVSEEEYLVGAFCGKECCGIGEYVDGSLFMTVHGQKGDEITFKAFDNAKAEIRDFKETLEFDENHLGSIDKPFELNLKESSGVNEILVGYGLHVTPNPVKDRMHIVGNLSEVKSVKVISTSGMTLISTDSFENGVDVSGLNDGAYIAAIVTSFGTIYEKFLKIGF